MSSFVSELKHVGGRAGVDDGSGDQLVHGLVVGRLGGVVHEAGAAAVDRAGEEGHADGLLVRDALQGTDEIGALEILSDRVREERESGERESEGMIEGIKLPWIHGSIGLSARLACRCPRTGSRSRP